jgi:hypothetical protein
MYQTVEASNPWFNTVIKSPTNSTYETSPPVIEMATYGLSGANVYYSSTYSLDGKQNVTIPFITETHEKSFSITMTGIVALPLLSEGFHIITVYEKVDIGTTPPKTYSENYTVNFAVAQQTQLSPSIAPSPTINETQLFNSQQLESPIPTAIAVIIVMAVVLLTLVYFKRRKGNP